MGVISRQVILVPSVPFHKFLSVRFLITLHEYVERPRDLAVWPRFNDSSYQCFPPVRLQTTLPVTDVSGIRFESALADSVLPARRAVSCTLYSQSLFQYHNGPGCVCTPLRSNSAPTGGGGCSVASKRGQSIM